MKVNGFKNEYVGLNNIEIEQSYKKYGKNEIDIVQKSTFLKKIIEVITEPMFILLFVTATIYFFLGEIRDGIIMLCFVGFMSGIEIFQEWRTDRTLEALKDLASPFCKVIRNEEIQNIDSRELVQGDIIYIEEGDKISADGVILENHDLGIDESILTGESDTVWKKDEGICYSGTMVIQGSAVVKITAIGKNTEYGKIGTELSKIKEEKAPLENQIDKLVKVFASIAIILLAIVTVITFLNTRNITTAILAGITLAMGIIPEEFPVILTVFLAMGAWRLAKNNALIRKITSVETLGAISVLCVDKTGTLTMNQMAVKEAIPYKKYDLEYLRKISCLACETEPYDPMEKAILEDCSKNGINKQKLFSNELIFEYPFSSETKVMGHIWNIENKKVLAVKGSPEVVFKLCKLENTELETIEKAQEKLSKKGYRVLAIAVNEDISEVKNTLNENELTLVGIIALMDPPREEVKKSIQICNQAGIRVIMITGDNGLTAKSIAKSIGLSHNENVITGDELEIMQDDELKSRIKETNIFARVYPRHKMRIIQALKETGEIVAMTGDGVNDAPALKSADIGIAMGKRGNTIAKEAADMILLDDNFTTIVTTIKDGRRIYDNIRKAIGYVIIMHIPIALAALIVPILNLPMLLLPIHVVLLELVIDPTCSLVYEKRRADSGIMERKPRKIDEKLLTKSMILQSIIYGTIVFIIYFCAYYFLLNIYQLDEDFSRNIAFAVLILCNLCITFSAIFYKREKK